jgi:hypothetical protein
MKAFLKSSFAILLLVFISCNPDEELDNNGNSGNNGNTGNTGNTSATSYPEIINLLVGNWYGEGHEVVYPSGQIYSYPQNTIDVGYITFGSSNNGTANFDFPDGFTDPPYGDLLVSKHPVSVTITNGSWSGTGPEYLRLSGSYQELAKESNYFADKSYCIVEYTTPFYNVSTPTIQYGIRTTGWLNPGVPSDISLFALYTEFRIHTINNNTLKLAREIGEGIYYIVTYTKL